MNEIEVQPLSEQTTPESILPSSTDPVSRRRKVPFKIKLLLLASFALIFVLLYMKIHQQVDEYRRIQIDFKKDQDEIKVVDVPDVDSVFYKNDEYKFSLEYPASAEFEELPGVDDNSISITIRYVGNRQNEPVITDESLTDGYMFTIYATKDILNQNIEEIAERKITTYQRNCPEIARVGSVSTGVIDTLPSANFSVVNCLADYEESFVVHRDILFEIVQVYRGDLGYKELYKRSTGDILSSLYFIDKPTEVVVIPDEKPYENPTYKFSFNHNNLDSSCCDIAHPVAGSFDKLVVLADPSTVSNDPGRTFDGIGVFVTQNRDKLSFEEFVDLQKRTLIEDHKIIMKVTPQPITEAFTLDGVEGVLLKDHAWWGDVYYFQVPNSNRFLTIVKTERSPGSFDALFDKIVKSFKFL